MQQFDFPVPSALPHMRPFPDEYNSRKACNDADPCATVRQRVHCIYLAPPLNAQAGAKVQTGLSSGLQSHLVGSLYGDAVEVPACADRLPWAPGYSLYDGLQSLCQMG